MNDRYSGKPFLRVVESYVLRVLGALDAETEALMMELTPKLQSIYGIRKTWEEITREALALPSDFEVKLKEIWERNLSGARRDGIELDVRRFTIDFVDKYLVNR